MRGLRGVLERVNGRNYLRGAVGEEMAEHHVDESGIVVALRYPPRAAFGLVPDREWMMIQVAVDEMSPVVAGLGMAEPMWFPLAVGRHHIRIATRSGERVLDELEIELPAAVGRPRIVDVFPRRRRGVRLGYARPSMCLRA